MAELVLGHGVILEDGVAPPHVPDFDHAVMVPTGDEVALKFLIYPVLDERIQKELKIMQILAGFPNLVTYRDLLLVTETPSRTTNKQQTKRHIV